MCNLKFFNKIKKYLKDKWKILLTELIISLALIIVSIIVIKYIRIFPITGDIEKLY